MNYSFQLYSARNFGTVDETLGLLAALGYTKVEGYGGILENPAALRASLDRHQLSMPSTHISLQALEEDFDKILQTSILLKVETIFCPHLSPGERPENTEGWIAIADRLSAVGKLASDAGLHFGWHNHDFEFAYLPDGSCPMEIILDNAPLLDWEADIAWIKIAGGEPLEWIKRYAERITAVHLKDIAPVGECTDEDGWADVGHGTTDWKATLRTLNEYCPKALCVMEHDNPNDLERFARRSIEAVRHF